MPSPRTEADRAEPTGRLHLPRGLAAVYQRLNTRLVLAIGSVALVGLLVSAAYSDLDLSNSFRGIQDYGVALRN